MYQKRESEARKAKVKILSQIFEYHLFLYALSNEAMVTCKTD